MPCSRSLPPGQPRPEVNRRRNSVWKIRLVPLFIQASRPDRYVTANLNRILACTHTALQKASDCEADDSRDQVSVPMHRLVYSGILRSETHMATTRRHFLGSAAMAGLAAQSASA